MLLYLLEEKDFSFQEISFDVFGTQSWHCDMISVISKCYRTNS